MTTQPRPYYLRPHQRLKRIAAEAFYFVCALFALFIVGVSFYLIFTPALPILIPMLEPAKQVAPAPERSSTLGKHL